MLFDKTTHNYDALLVVSFGGPEGPDDVVPFLDNVFRSLPVSQSTRDVIAERYLKYGGVSPINSQVRQFIDALRVELEHHGPALPIYWGNRNWHPLLPDTLAQMERDGIQSACAFITSVFSCYSSCRRYREDLHAAAAPLAAPPSLDRLRFGFNHPGFIEAMADRAREALAHIPPEQRDATPILFTAHSLPEGMAQHSSYEAQLFDASRLVADALEHSRWRCVYQSNNARYGGEPWLGPDISEALLQLKQEGATHVVIAPIGFVCDHMEVIIDLDVIAAATAEDAGLHMVRAGTVGTHPAYVAMVRELLIERMSAQPTRRTLGNLGPAHDFCPPDCCLSGRPGPAKPVIGGSVADGFSSSVPVAHSPIAKVRQKQS